MNDPRQRHTQFRTDVPGESSFISNTFAHVLHLKDFIEILAAAHHSLRLTNQTIESMYTKQQLLSTTLSVSQFLDKVWFGRDRQANRALLYSIYGLQTFPTKAGMSKRNELIGHLNIMTMNLGQKLKESVFDDSLYYTTEEDLFRALLKAFHAKLFESPVFRKVLYYLFLYDSQLQQQQQVDM